MSGEHGSAWRILYVDAITTGATRYRDELSSVDAFSIVEAGRPQTAYTRLAEGVDLTVCRHRASVETQALLETIRTRHPNLPVIVIGPDEDQISDRVLAAGATEYVPDSDPNGPKTLRDRVWLTLEDGHRIRADGAGGMPIEDLSVRDELRLKERAMDAAPIGITISDPDRPDNPLIYLNDAFESLTGYTSAETVGRNCRFLQGEASDEAAITEMREGIDEGVPVSVELINYRKNGETFWNRVDIAPIRNEAGEVTNYVGFQTDITARKEAEFEVKEERARLDHLLSRINGLMQEVTTALVEAVTRDDIEEAVCERIVATDVYDFAWIGEPDFVQDRIVPTSWAGGRDLDPHLLEVSLDGSNDDDHAPINRAFETGELQVVTDSASLASIVERPSWLAYGPIRGVAAIPLVYRDNRYGVLTVYTTEPDVLTDHDTVVLEALGQATATAINAIERGRIIVADNVVELEFSIRDRDLFFVDLTAEGRPPIEYNGSIYRDDGTALMFFTTTASLETVEIVVAAHDDIQDVTLVSQSKEGNVFEFTVAPNSIIMALAERGARTRGMSAETGVGHIMVELPTEADVRAILSLLNSRYDGTELTAYRERERPPETKQEFLGRVKDLLTEQQLTALQTAYVSGYYEWNRPVTGDDLAATMGVARSTFHQHLRAAERKLVGEIFPR